MSFTDLPSDEEIHKITNALRQWDIYYLSSYEFDEEYPKLPAKELIQSLVHINDSRIQYTIISLLLLHPEITEVVAEILHEEQKTPDYEELKTLILATLYLQRLWSFRLQLALQHSSLLGEQIFASLWAERNLPPPGYYNGRWGLILLQEAEQRRIGIPSNFLAEWQEHINHLLYQEEQNYRFPVSPIKLQKKLLEDSVFSQKPPVDKNVIELFLTMLGKAVQKTERVFLVGSTSLIHADIRNDTTVGIDIYIPNVQADTIQTIYLLEEQLQISITFIFPEEYMPLPPEWKERSRFVGHYNNIELFYLDFLSQTLIKLARGNDNDIHDAQLLINSQQTTLEELDQAYIHALPYLEYRPYSNVDVRRFILLYSAIRQTLLHT